MRPAFEEGYERHCDLGERPPRTQWQLRHGDGPIDPEYFEDEPEDENED